MVSRLLPSVVIVAVLVKVLPISGLLGVFVYGIIFVALYCASAYFFVMNGFEKQLCNKYLSKIFGVFG